MRRFEIRWIAALWRPFGGWLILILVLTVTSTAAAVSLPLVLKSVFDGFALRMNEAALLWSVAAYLAIGSLLWALTGALMLVRGSMNLRFEWAARQRAYAALLRKPPGFFQKFRTGDIVTRLTDDVSDKLSWFVCSGIFRAIAAGLVIVFGVAMMARLDPLLTLFTAGPLPLLILLFVRAGTVLDRRFADVQTRISTFNDALEACFSGIRVVKACGREEAEERAFARFAEDCRSSEIAAARSQTLINSLYGQAWQLGVVGVLLAGGAAVMSGRLTLGTFVAFDAYVLMLVFPMLDIGTFFVRGWQSAVSIGRLREIEEAREGVLDMSPAHPSPSLQGRLSFESVGTSHPGHGAREALSEVSFELRPGEILAVAGKVGSGKSVLVRLMPRLMDPTSGRILLDGTDIRYLALSALRRAVGYVPQDPVLFSDSIRENIRFARDWLREVDIQRAADIACLGKDIAALIRGLDTRVGPRGVSLSGGQKQRVALARALAGSPRVLVLDDATASLDAETEAGFWEALRRALPELATIVVTHRTATLERADRIIVLAEGRVSEAGTHAELSRDGTLYRSLYQRHALEERVGLEEGRDRF